MRAGGILHGTTLPIPITPTTVQFMAIIGLPPDQAIANVQATLQQQGYYRGEVDGELGPLTRAALANYQRDHGLYMI